MHDRRDRRPRSRPSVSSGGHLAGDSGRPGSTEQQPARGAGRTTTRGRARATTERDGGQMMAALVIGLCVTLLAFLVVALVPVGAATERQDPSQTAADAAALAGAQAVRRHWVVKDTSPGG